MPIETYPVKYEYGTWKRIGSQIEITISTKDYIQVENFWPRGINIDFFSAFIYARDYQSETTTVRAKVNGWDSEMVDKYQKIKDLGLQVFTKPYHTENQLVSADDLLELLDAGVEVYTHSDSKKPSYWGPKENGQFNDTHTGLIINIKELKPKQVTITRDELYEALKSVGGFDASWNYETLAKKLGL